MNTRASLNMSLPIRHSVAIIVWNGRRQERNSIPVLFSSFFSSTSSFFFFIRLLLMNSCLIRCLVLVRSFSSQLFFHVTLTPIYSPGKMLRRSRPDKENSAKWWENHELIGIRLVYANDGHLTVILFCLFFSSCFWPWGKIRLSSKHVSKTTLSAILQMMDPLWMKLHLSVSPARWLLSCGPG